jgi:hypothetical protein
MRQANHDRITTRHTAMLPAPMAPSAFACPPAGSTSPGMGRRALLARALGVLGLGATANVAAIVSTRSGPLVSIAEVLPPAIPAPAEAPELLALGRELDRLTAVYIEAAERQARAIELFNQLAPAVPDDLLHDPGKSMLWRTVLACEVRGGRQGYFTKAHQAFVLSEEECDLHGKRPYLDLPCRRSRAPLSVKQGGDVDSVLVARRRHRTRRACSKP